MKYLILLLIFASVCMDAKAVCIKNFNKELCEEFILLDSVILKSKLSKKELIKKIRTPLQEIAFLGDARLFLLNTNNPLRDAEELSKRDFIIYAQPNVSQKQIKSFKRTEDFNTLEHVENLWKDTKGEGVNIAIIDDGFDLKHDDLKNTRLLFSYDADLKSLDASPKTQYDIHGTQVAGIIFAQHNSIGTNGIAPKANLIAIRQVSNVTSNIILAFSVAKKAKANIINSSWNTSVLLEPVYDVIKYISKDTFVVFAAGNTNSELKPLMNEAAIPEVITVGSKAPYSNYGGIVDFVAEDKFYTTKTDNKYGKFQGTSASAPFVSGLIALDISLYPDYDQKEILKLLKKQLEN